LRRPMQEPIQNVDPAKPQLQRQPQELSAEPLPMPQALPLPNPQASSLISRRALFGGLMLLAGAVAATTLSTRTMAPSGDSVSAQDVARIEQAFSTATGRMLPVDMSSVAQKNAVKAAFVMSEADVSRAMPMVENGKLAIGWLKLWDNYQQDNDTVSVTAGGFSQRIVLQHKPVTIPVVYVPGEPVYITGEYDGGGGITIAVELTTGPLPFPIMKVGQTIALPVR
jgi:hypothetical protein